MGFSLYLVTITILLAIHSSQASFYRGLESQVNSPDVAEVELKEKDIVFLLLLMFLVLIEVAFICIVLYWIVKLMVERMSPPHLTTNQEDRMFQGYVKRHQYTDVRWD